MAQQHEARLAQHACQQGAVEDLGVDQRFGDLLHGESLAFAPVW
jgi:hypothetical protein